MIKKKLFLIFGVCIGVFCCFSSVNAANISLTSDSPDVDFTYWLGIQSNPWYTTIAYYTPANNIVGDEFHISGCFGRYDGGAGGGTHLISIGTYLNNIMVDYSDSLYMNNYLCGGYDINARPLTYYSLSFSMNDRITYYASNTYTIVAAYQNTNNYLSWASFLLNTSSPSIPVNVTSTNSTEFNTSSTPRIIFPLLGDITDLIIPSPSALQANIDDLKGTFETKVPFAYFYQIMDLLEVSSSTFQSETASTTTLYVPLDVEGTGINLLIFDTENQIFQDFMEQIRPIFSYGMWFLFLIYLLNRFKYDQGI